MKKISLSSEDLKKALKKLGQAVNEKTVLPITKDILIRTGDKSIVMYSTDIEIMIAFTVPAELPAGQASFDLLLPFDFLAKITSAFKAAPVVIEHPSARKAAILCGEDRFELSGLNKPEEFPKVPELPAEYSLPLDQRFISSISLALLTTNQKETMRPTLTRVMLDITPTATAVVSTDAHSLYRFVFPVEAPGTQQVQVNAKMVKAIEGMSELTLSWTEKMIAFRNEQITVWCRLYDDRYPDYKAVIPTYGPNLTISRGALIEGLQKSLITADGAYLVTFHLTGEAGQIRLASENVDDGRKSQVKLLAEYTGTEELISVNAKLMLVVLSQIEQEEVQLHIKTRSHAMLLSAKEDPGYTGLMMPIHVTQ